jgi:hypothetical protein
MEEILKNGRKIKAIVASVHEGKTTTLLNMIEIAKKIKSKHSRVCCYFYHQEYKQKVKGVEFVHTLNELEQIKDSFIFIDEFGELFQIQDRHNQEKIKTLLGQIEHNNNILVLCGLPEYFNKLLSSKVNDWILKGINYDEIINGSNLKKYINGLSGDFKGSTRLNIPVNVALNNGVFYEVKYNKARDKKAENISLFK